jgi:hypothetical protein
VGRLGWGVVVASLALMGSDAVGQSTGQDDGIPSGTVAFFAGTSCPPGWTRPDDVKGRMVVAVVDGGTVGVRMGTPLADRENRTHQHDYSVSVTLAPPAAGPIGAGGGSVPGAQAQTYTVTGQSDPAPTDLPLVQLLACEKP